MLYSLSSTINNILISSSAACIDFACLNQLHITLGLLLVLNFIGVCKKSVIQHTCICEIEEEKRSCNDVHMYIYIYTIGWFWGLQKEVKSTQKQQIKGGSQEMAAMMFTATKWLPPLISQLFSPMAFKATPFFHSLAVFVWIYILYVPLSHLRSKAQTVVYK